MYYYIYDSFLTAPRYRKILERIEVHLAHFGIQGKIKRLNILHHQKEAIEESIRRGAKTIVLVGDDRGIVQAIDTLAKYDIVVGLIPLGHGEHLRIARTLGIPPETFACEVLSRRTIARLDLGKIASHYFLTTAEVQATTFRCVFPRRTFHVEPIVAKANLTVINLAPAPTVQEEMPRTNPRDGILELIIRDTTSSFSDIFRTKKTKKTPSIFPVSELTITEPEGVSLTLDGWRSVKLPVTISVVPQKLRVIVGRERLFT